MCDVPGEAKASGNLGNTLKVLGRYDEAIVCCDRHLELARQMNDKVSHWTFAGALPDVHGHVARRP